jgi:hypothetical protein
MRPLDWEHLLAGVCLRSFACDPLLAINWLVITSLSSTACHQQLDITGL